MYTKLLLIGLISIYSTIGLSQYYNCLSDLSGIGIHCDQDASEQAAMKVATSMPSNYVDSFKVYTIGYYLHSNSFVDGENVFTALAINTIKTESPYYLLIIRVINPNNAIERINSIVNLPIHDSLDCIDPGQLNVLNSIISQQIMDSYENSNKNNLDYLLSEIKGINYLYEYVIDKKICCSERTFCEECYSESALEVYLKQKKYSILSLQNIEYELSESSSQFYNQKHELSITYNNLSLNVNQDIIPFVEEFSEYSDQIFVNIQFYENYDNIICNAVLESISQNHTFDISKPYFYLNIIGYNSSETGKSIAFKLETNIKQNGKSGSGTLYFINLDSSTDTKSLIDSCNYFFRKAGITSIHTEKLLADNSCDIGQTDGVIIIGKERSKIFNYLTNQVELCDFISDPDYASFLEWAKNNVKSNIERTRKYIGVISTLPDGLNTYYLHYDKDNPTNRLSSSYTNRKYRLLGFVVLHATAHMSEYVHWTLDDEQEGFEAPANIKEGRGFADEAIVIKNKLLDPYSDEWATFEKIIQWTITNHIHVINDINERFK